MGSCPARKLGVKKEENCELKHLSSRNKEINRDVESSGERNRYIWGAVFQFLW